MTLPRTLQDWLAHAARLHPSTMDLSLERTVEVAQRLGTDSYMVDNADELRDEWFVGKPRVGLTAGASAPEVLVKQVIERIKAMGAVSVRSMPGQLRPARDRCMHTAPHTACTTSTAPPHPELPRALPKPQRHGWRAARHPPAA